MKLSDQYDGSAYPLEGDRTIIWRSLPVGAQLASSIITVTPVADPSGVLFEEVISFVGNLGSLGATKDGGGGSAFVEVDFHKRRTLAAVTGVTGTGSLPVGATLQVDLGGLYVEINDNGAIKSPGDIPFMMKSDGLLPGLTVSKFKLTQANADVGSVTIRSVPTNLSVRFGDLRPFWSVTGELSTSADSPDFSSVLQKFLTKAQVENGFYLVPFVVHTDTVARLQININVEFVNQVSLLPPDLPEAVLPFDYATIPNGAPNLLSINLPAGARILAGQTMVRVLGAFSNTRIVSGIGLPPGAPSLGFTVALSPDESQAQSLAPDQSFQAVSADLLLAALSSTQLSLDLRPDFNGKPDSVSLLPEPVSFAISPNAYQEPVWVNVPFAQPFNFEIGKAYWLVLASLQGDSEWIVQAASPGKPGVQHTLDGGLSWHPAGALGVNGPLAASFRLRNIPSSFQMPIQLRVGTANAKVPVALDRYQPLARVDFVLNTPELADAFNKYLVVGVPPPLPEGEHLTNGRFDKWSVVGNAVGAPYRLTLDGFTTHSLAVSHDGRWVYVGVSHSGNFAIQRIDAVCGSKSADEIQLQAPSAPLAMAVHPSDTRAYVITSTTLHLVDLARGAELGVPLQVGQLAIGAAADFGPNLALSPDGSQLYLTSAGVIASIGTAALESAIRGLQTLALQDVRSLAFSSEPPAIFALIPDGTRLFLATPGSTELQVMDTASFVLEANRIELDSNPVSIDFTPDGSFAIVVTTENDTAALIDTATGNVVETSALAAKPIAVAASRDGTRAFVLLSESLNAALKRAALVSLRKLPVAMLSLGSRSTAVMAVSPQSDRVYIESHGDALTVVPLAARVPADWFVTSEDPACIGVVTPVCFPQDSPFGLGLAFGQRSRHGFEPNDAATGFSQVVPAAPACPFEFSFRAVSDSTLAVAELLWLDQGGNLLRKDSVPIQTQPGGPTASLWDRVPVAVSSGELLPILHRTKVTSPPGTAQVEVRFTIPDGASALLAETSLDATSEALVNNDLQMLKGGLPVGWTRVSQAIRGVAFIYTGNSVKFVNSSIGQAELVQTMEVGGGNQFTFEFLGSIAEFESSKQSARLELKWLKADGSPAAAPTNLEIPIAGFGRFTAAGTTAAGTTQVEVHLKAPAGVTLEIRRISFKMPQPAPVPVTFVAAAPGELRVSNSVVSYDRIPIPLPAAPAHGVAPPTPPGQMPGAKSGDQTYCPCCQKQVLMTRDRTRVKATGQPFSTGCCPECGSQLQSGGDKLAGRIPLINFPVLPDHDKAPSVFVRPAADRLKKILRPLVAANSRRTADRTRPSIKPEKRDRS
jgi:DNA-binding beta-propeller fold protein YncE